MSKPITAAEAGRKGGNARAARLTPAERQRIARMGATAMLAKRKARKDAKAIL